MWHFSATIADCEIRASLSVRPFRGMFLTETKFRKKFADGWQPVASFIGDTTSKDEGMLWEKGREGLLLMGFKQINVGDGG